MPQWTSAANVAARLTYGTIDATSNPSTADVGAWLDELEAEVRVRLRGVGLATTITDTDSLAFVRGRIVGGAVARVLRAWGVQGRPALLEEADALDEAWAAFLDDLDKHPTRFGERVSASGDVPAGRTTVRSHLTHPGLSDGRASITEGWIP